MPIESQREHGGVKGLVPEDTATAAAGPAQWLSSPGGWQSVVPSAGATRLCDSTPGNVVPTRCGRQGGGAVRTLSFGALPPGSLLEAGQASCGTHLPLRPLCVSAGGGHWGPGAGPGAEWLHGHCAGRNRSPRLSTRILGCCRSKGPIGRTRHVSYFRDLWTLTVRSLEVIDSHLLFTAPRPSRADGDSSAPWRGRSRPRRRPGGDKDGMLTACVQVFLGLAKNATAFRSPRRDAGALCKSRRKVTKPLCSRRDLRRVGTGGAPGNCLGQPSIPRGGGC